MSRNFIEQENQPEGNPREITDMDEPGEVGFWMAVVSILACIFTIGFVVGATIGRIQG